MTAPKVALVFLNWNGRDDLLHCLSTLPRLTYPNLVATVVDNGSTDGSLEALASRFPEQRTLALGRNFGFAGGNNRGIADALALGAEYVLLLNTDTELHAELVTELIRVAESESRVAALGAKNLRLGNPEEVWGAWNDLVWDEGLVRVAGQGKPDGPEFDIVRDVDAVIGNGMMMRRAAIEQVGVFDEAFFAYHEDIDWCTRARSLGYRNIYCGRAVVYHRGFSTSTRPVPFPTLYFLGRNGILFARKHGSRAQQMQLAQRFLTSVLRRLTAAALRGERVKPYLWMLRGFAHGVSGRTPPSDLRIQ